MPVPRLDDANIEYSFSAEELHAARFLDPLKIMWLQTKYAQLWKQKASMLLPEDGNIDRSYLMKLCEIEGQLNGIQDLLDDHKKAMEEYAEKVAVVAAGGEIPKGENIQTIAHEAASRVHNG
jgi:hypothetical protein